MWGPSASRECIAIDRENALEFTPLLCEKGCSRPIPQQKNAPKSSQGRRRTALLSPQRPLRVLAGPQTQSRGDSTDMAIALGTRWGCLAASSCLVVPRSVRHELRMSGRRTIMGCSMASASLELLPTSRLASPVAPEKLRMRHPASFSARIVGCHAYEEKMGLHFYYALQTR